MELSKVDVWPDMLPFFNSICQMHRILLVTLVTAKLLGEKELQARSVICICSYVCYEECIKHELHIFFMYYATTYLVLKSYVPLFTCVGGV